PPPPARAPPSPLFPYTTLSRSAICILRPADQRRGDEVVHLLRRERPPPREPTECGRDLRIARAVVGSGRHARRDLAERHVIGHRSEEHTSELQSLTNLVCRLLR